MTPETVRYRSNDDVHNQQDEQVYAATRKFGVQDNDQLSATTAGILLSEIVSASVGQLDPKFRRIQDAVSLVRSKPALLVLLNVAWQSKTFRDVRNLRFLNRNSEGPHNGTISSREQVVSYTSTAQAAWKTPYIGDRHRMLLNNINKMDRTGVLSNSVAIIQSSGYGKSRMVEEQSGLVFTLPFNLRSPWQGSEFAYPPSDQSVFEYLMKPSSVETMIRYLTFFCAMFDEVNEELSCLNWQDGYKSLAQSWRVHLQTAGNRNRIYANAVQRALGFDLNTIRDRYRPDEFSTLDALSRAARDALAKLLTKMASRSNATSDFTTSKDVKLMVYFDEAHVLAAQSDVQQYLVQKDNYDVMCSSLNAFIGLPIFVIFLSMNSGLNRIARQPSQSTSFLARQHPENLQAPITETPFDCSPKFPLKPGDLLLQDLYKIETLASFGRPMFWAFLKSSFTGVAAFESIISLARSKLLCESNLDNPVSYYSCFSQTALVDVLLNLKYELRRDMARNWEANLVTNHMRTVYSIPQDRTYMRSGYPSEPLLAEAAAQQIHAFQSRQPLNVMVNILSQSFQLGLLDQEQRGEIVCRVLIMTAYMRSVVADHPDSPHTFSKGCKLLTFISELFSDEYSKQILTSLPDNLESHCQFSNAFRNAVVRFTHFGRMIDGAGATTYASLAAFVRGMAMIGSSSQEGIDIVIPVLLDPSKRLSESVMSGILIQVKRRKTCETKAYEIDQKSLGFFPPRTWASNRPYVTIVMVLGVRHCIEPGAITSNVPVTRAITLASQIADVLFAPLTTAPPETIRHPRDTHPRYSIFAYGCSSTLYKVIHPTESVTYGLLLGTGDMFGEHPRQDQVSLAAVRQLKPFWTIGVESYHWIEQPFLQQNVEVDGLEGVFVRQFDESLRCWR